MGDRPELSRTLSAEVFRQWYWLKEELVQFCRDNGLPVSGGKTELAERIAYYLETGGIQKSPTGRNRSVHSKLASDITPDSLIESDFVCSQRHRAFFIKQLGRSFTFSVAFQKWLKSNAGKTYADAVEVYQEIRKNRKTKKTTIEGQFEYNTYIREFFRQNKGRSLADAIRCWNYKKSQPGHHRYEESDLAVLSRPENIIQGKSRKIH